MFCDMTPKYSFSVEFRRDASGVYRGVSIVAGTAAE